MPRHFPLRYFRSLDTNVVDEVHSTNLWLCTSRKRNVMQNVGNGKEKKARILVVDCEQTEALTLSAILRMQGYSVSTSFSGEDAVAKAAHFIPDLLVSDVYLGGMNGVLAATRITTKKPSCGVLFLSSLATLREVQRAAPEHLVYSYVSKPLHQLDFLDAIAYKLSAANAVNHYALMIPDHYTIQNEVTGKAPTKAEFIFRGAETGVGKQTAPPGVPGAMFFDVRLPQAAAL